MESEAVCFELQGMERAPESWRTWVWGMSSTHRFSALVFPVHAKRSEYELCGSGISKLEIRRFEGDEITFNWDRGLDIRGQDEGTRQLKESLCQMLAYRIFGRPVT